MAPNTKTAISVETLVLPFRISSIYCSTPEDSGGDETYVRCGRAQPGKGVAWIYSSSTIKMHSGVSAKLGGLLEVYFASWNWELKLASSLVEAPLVNKYQYIFEVVDRDGGPSGIDSDDSLGIVTLSAVELLTAYVTAKPLSLSFKGDGANYTLTVVPPSNSEVSKSTKYHDPTLTYGLKDILYEAQLQFFRESLSKFFTFPDRAFWRFLTTAEEQKAFLGEIKDVVMSRGTLKLDVKFMPWTEVSALWTMIAAMQPFLFLNSIQCLVNGNWGFVTQGELCNFPYSVPTKFASIDRASRDAFYYNWHIPEAPGTGGAFAKVCAQYWCTSTNFELVLSPLAWVLCGSTAATIANLSKKAGTILTSSTPWQSGLFATVPDVTAPNPFGCLIPPAFLADFAYALGRIGCTKMHLKGVRQNDSFFETIDLNTILYLPGANYRDNKVSMSSDGQNMSWGPSLPQPNYGFYGIAALYQSGTLTEQTVYVDSNVGTSNVVAALPASKFPPAPHDVPSYAFWDKEKSKGKIVGAEPPTIQRIKTIRVTYVNGLSPEQQNVFVPGEIRSKVTLTTGGNTYEGTVVLSERSRAYVGFFAVLVWKLYKEYLPGGAYTWPHKVWLVTAPPETHNKSFHSSAIFEPFYALRFEKVPV